MTDIANVEAPADTATAPVNETYDIAGLKTATAEETAAVATAVAGLPVVVQTWIYGVASVLGIASGVVMTNPSAYPHSVVAVAGTVAAVCVAVNGGVALSHRSK